MPVAQFDVELNYDTRKADASLSAFRANALGALADLSNRSAKIDLLGSLSADVKVAEGSLKDLKTRAEELKRILATMAQGDAGFKQIAAELKAANGEMKALELSIAKGSKEFNKLTASSGESAAAIQAAQSKVDALLVSFGRAEIGTTAFKSIRTELLAADRDLTKLTTTAEKNAARLQEIALASQTANQRLVVLRESANTLNEALKKTTEGQVGFKTLTENLKSVEKEIRATERAVGSQIDELKSLEAELGLSAKNTAALAAEQLALAKALETAQRANAVQTARSVLGVTGAAEAEGQIKKLTEAYAVLRASGSTTTNELAIAKANLNAKIREVNASLAGTTTTAQSLSSVFATLAIGAYAIGGGLTSAASAAIAYEQGIARVSSITTQNKAQLAEMGQEVLKLTQKIGIDLPTAFNALYEIISSGIPPDNALKVLELSAQAAIAGVTDVNTAARLGVAILNAYGKQVSELPRIFDVLFQTIKDGVVTFPELANTMGEILPIAKTAGVSLDEVAASMVVLTKNGLSAAEASTGIQRAIQALSAPTPEAIAGMTRLGIKYEGFLGTLRQIADRNLSADVIRTIIPDVRGERVVSIFAQQYGVLDSQFKEVTESAGATKSAFDKLANTPEQQIKKFTASITALKVELGEALVNRIADGLPNLTRLVAAIAEGERRFQAFSFVLGQMTPGFQQASVSAAQLNPLLAQFGPALEKAGIKAGEARFQFGALEQKFLDLTKATEQSAATAVKAAAEYSTAFGPVAEKVNNALVTINTQITQSEGTLKLFAERLASTTGASKTLFDQAVALTKQNLDRVTTEVETAIARREISERDGLERIATLRQVSFNTDLANIKTYSVSALALFDKETEARRALVIKNAGNAKAAADQLLTFDIKSRDDRIKLIGDIQAKQAAYYQAITNEEKALTDVVRKNEDEKLAIRERVAGIIRDAVRAGLTEQKKLQDELREAEELRVKANEEAQKGNLDLAIKYYNRSIELAAAAAKQGAEDEKKGKKDAADAIIEQSKRSTEEQIKNTLEVAQKVRESNDLEREGAIARRSGISALESAQTGLLAVYDQTAEAARKANKDLGVIKENAASFADDLAKQLSTVRAQQAAEIPLRIKQDSQQVDTAINDLKTELAQREVFVAVKVTTDQALQAAQKLKDDIEKGAPQVKIDADLTALKQHTDEALKALPKAEIEADDTKIRDSLKGIGTSIDDLGKKRVELQSNANEVADKLAEINGLTFNKKTLTIEVNYTYPNGKPTVSTDALGGATGAGSLPGFAGGGLVSFDGPKARAAALQHFATGGFVGSVPGVGDSDSVFRLLQSGSFVLRKDAVRALKQRVLPGGRALPGGRDLANSSLAGGIAGGSGFSGDLASLVDAVNQRATFERGGAIASLMEASIRQLRNNVTDYRKGKPLGFVEPGAEDLTENNARPKVRAVEDLYSRAAGARNESDAQSASQTAIALAQELVKPLSDIDFKAFQGSGPGGNFFAAGGMAAGAGMVPAMLTPGEIVFGPEDVKRIGLPVLNAANMGRLMAFANGGEVPRFADTFAASALPMLRHFNEGGHVSNVGGSSTTNVTFAPNVTINAASDVDVRQSVRNILPEFKEALRRQGIKL